MKTGASLWQLPFVSFHCGAAHCWTVCQVLTAHSAYGALSGQRDSTLLSAAVEYKTECICNSMKFNQGNAIQCESMQFDAIRCYLIQSDTIRYNAIEFDTIRYSLIQFHKHIHTSSTSHASISFPDVKSSGGTLRRIIL